MQSYTCPSINGEKNKNGIKLNFSISLQYTDSSSFTHGPHGWWFSSFLSLFTYPITVTPPGTSRTEILFFVTCINNLTRQYLKWYTNRVVIQHLIYVNIIFNTMIKPGTIISTSLCLSLYFIRSQELHGTLQFATLQPCAVCFNLLVLPVVSCL